jgi:hypothetical protein
MNLVISHLSMLKNLLDLGIRLPALILGDTRQMGHDSNAPGIALNGHRGQAIWKRDYPIHA